MFHETRWNLGRSGEAGRKKEQQQMFFFVFGGAEKKRQTVFIFGCFHPLFHPSPRLRPTIHPFAFAFPFGSGLFSLRQHDVWFPRSAAGVVCVHLAKGHHENEPLMSLSLSLSLSLFLVHSRWLAQFQLTAAGPRVPGPRGPLAPAASAHRHQHLFQPNGVN